MAAIVVILLSTLSGNGTLLRSLAPPLILALSCLLLVWAYYEYHTGTLHLPALNLSRPGRLHTADRKREPILFYFWLTMYVVFGVVMVLIFGAIVFFEGSVLTKWSGL
jgi:hypothetical protein